MRKLLLLLLLIPQILFSQVLEKEITDWEFRMVGDSFWKNAKVPGTIIDNFVDLSNISNPLHPYYGDNEKLYQWIGEKDWEFRTQINIHEITKDKNYTYKIEFGSLDLFADVYVNGIKYNSNNAFIPFEIPDLRDSVLNIHVIFHSTQNIVLELQKNDTLQIPGGERVYARTPQHQFGWDWGPRFMNMGIRKPVKLKIIPSENTSLQIEDIKLNINKEMGELSFKVDIQTPLKYFDINLSKWENGKKIYTETSTADIIYPKSITAYKYFFDDIQLWWPNGTGKHSNYYEFDIKITLPGDTTTIACERFYYAACDIKLVQEKDTYGESFYFTVNGENVFAKGANYIPDDSFDPGKNTQQLVQLAAGANMNMLRVWGGGTYPDDDFYIECMKNGIMVWQDFMFACSMNPGDQDFLSSVAYEASHQVERLKEFNHIAVWCGNNENEEGWRNWGWQKDMNIHGEDSVKMWKNYDVVFNKILPETIGTANQLYGTHFNYISTSPKHGWGRKESMTEGDSHYWGVWWGLEPIEKYNEKVPRFMSEFGMQGMPDMETLKKVIPDSAMNFNSPQFKNHQKHPTGYKTLNHYLKEYLVVPDNMEDYAYATQILQSYALTTAIEAQRRAMPYCMGSLIWQLNDCWPVTSWSLVDSELKKKMAYKDVSRAFESVIISMKEETSSFDIYVVNDNGFDLKEYKIFYKIRNFTGQVIIDKKKHITIKKESSNLVVSIPKKILKELDITQIYLEVSLTISNISEMPFKYFHFTKLNKLKLPKPNFIIKPLGNNYYQLSSDVYTPYLYIEGTTVKNETLTKHQSITFKAEDDKISTNSDSKIRCLNNLLNK